LAGAVPGGKIPLDDFKEGGGRGGINWSSILKNPHFFRKKKNSRKLWVVWGEKGGMTFPGGFIVKGAPVIRGAHKKGVILGEKTTPGCLYRGKGF